jgi:hypothetical protein
MNADQVTASLHDALKDRITPLHVEFDRLALAYIHAAGDAGLGLELMSERLFERLAADLYPGGWAGLLAHAMRKSG